MKLHITHKFHQYSYHIHHQTSPHHHHNSASPLKLIVCTVKHMPMKSTIIQQYASMWNLNRKFHLSLINKSPTQTQQKKVKSNKKNPIFEKKKWEILRCRQRWLEIVSSYDEYFLPYAFLLLDSPFLFSSLSPNFVKLNFMPLKKKKRADRIGFCFWAFLFGL